MNEIEHTFDEAFSFFFSYQAIEDNPLYDIRNANDQLLEDVSLDQEQARVSNLITNQLLIKGAAGSGKSITLVARMIKQMAETTSKRFLFVSFNNQLVKDARYRFKRSPLNEELKSFGHEVDFLTFHNLADRLLNKIGVKVPSFNTSHRNLKRTEENMKAKMWIILKRLNSKEYNEYPPLKKIQRTNNIEFLMEEFYWMKRNGFVTEEDYLNCERTGRGRLPRVTTKQRRTVYKLFEEYLELQRQDFQNRIDKEDYALLLWKNRNKILDMYRYDYIYVDEVQDLQPMQLKILVDLCKGDFAMSGDDKQRVYKSSPFSYKELGIDIRNNNNILLTKNWRSTYEIMKLANSLAISKKDEELKYEDEKYFRKSGEKPIIIASNDRIKMLENIIKKIKEIHESDKQVKIALLHRFNNSSNEHNVKQYLGRAFSVKTNIQENVEKGYVYLIEAKAAKGLEFDYVFILDFSNKFYPHIEEMTELRKKKQPTSSYEEDMKELIEKEKRVLYVAMSRAKKELIFHYFYKKDPEKEVSPFIRDFNTRDYRAKGFKKTQVK